MATVTTLDPQRRTVATQVVFDRKELSILLDIYGRLVAAGLIRDYAIAMTRNEASFAAYERTAERPDFIVVKRPALARKQGLYALINRDGAVLKRGTDLQTLVSLLTRRLIKAVEG